MKLNVFTNMGPRLMLAVIVIFLPIVWLTYYATEYYQRNTDRHIRNNASILLNAAIEDERHVADEIQQLMSTLSMIVDISDSDETIYRDMFLSVINRYPAYMNIGILSADGAVLSSAIPVESAAHIAGYPFFRKVIEQQSFAAGVYEPGENGETASLAFGYPVKEDSGDIAAVLFAILDMDWLRNTDMYLEQHIPAGSTLTWIDGTGGMLVNRPVPQPDDYVQYLAASIIPDVLAAKEGIVEGVFAGEDRIFAFQQVTDSIYGGAAYAILGIPRNIADGEANIIMEHRFGMIAIIGLISLVVILVVNRHILGRFSTLVETAGKIAHGDYGTRTNLKPSKDELGYLANAFDTMAAELERHNREREHVEQELKRSLDEREQLIHELQESAAKVQTLSGLVPICMHCKKVRDDKGYWEQVESFIAKHSIAEFSHGVCPDCMEKYYSNLARKDKKKSD